MAALVLDTCAFLWLGTQPSLLGGKVKRRLDAGEADVLLSDACVWEICLKWSAGKLKLPDPPRRWIEDQASIWRLGRLPLLAEDMYRSVELPALHRDPFDRLLVAQAIANDLVIATPDQVIRAYPVSTLW